MIERVVENWLTKAGERGYEVAFAQLLSAEGHRVLQGPVHHPYEHGKDIFSIAPGGELHAFQLKGPDLQKLDAFETIQPQLFALAGTAVTHPAVTPPRRPDRVFLVTSATLTPPVRDRVEKFNIANAAYQFPPIEPVEREQLTRRFVEAHGMYLPQELPDLRQFLEFYYAEPVTTFPVKRFAVFLEALLPFPPRTPSRAEARRAIASAALLTAYAASSWTQAGNHLSIAQAWLTLCATLLRFAEITQLPADAWRDSYALSCEAARTALAELAQEAAAARDLLLPDLTEGIVYGSRALLVCGFLSAYWLAERTLGPVDAAVTEHVRVVLTREVDRARIVGECDVPAFLLMASALEQLGEIRKGDALPCVLVRTLAVVNQRHSPRALADPYHDTEQILAYMVDLDSDLGSEEFDGRSYMLHIAIEWVARRLWRQLLASCWPQITRVEFMEFAPAVPAGYLAPKADGTLRMWFAGRPQSWGALLAQARTFDPAVLPRLLWEQHRELLPFVPLLLPYRFTATLAHAIDVIAAGPEAET